MQTILINEKDPLTKGITISGYISPNSSHTRLIINGVSLGDIAKLQPFNKYMQSGFNAIALELNNLTYTVLD